MPPIYQRYGLRLGDDEEQHWYPVAVPIALRLAMRSIVLGALAWSNGNQQKAADALKISPRMMNNMMIRYDVPRVQGVFHKRSPRANQKIGIAARQRESRKRVSAR